MKASDKLTKGGMYTVRVTPKDDDQNVYVGYLETEFAVIGRDLKEAGATIADIADVVYTGEAIEPEVTVTVGKTTLKLSEDYTVSYSDNIKGGEATVTVTGINDYSGTITKNFKITRAAQGIEMTNPLQERDLANGSRNSYEQSLYPETGYSPWQMRIPSSPTPPAIRVFATVKRRQDHLSGCW